MTTESTLMTAGQGSTDTAAPAEGNTTAAPETQAPADTTAAASEQAGGQEQQSTTAEAEAAPQGAPEQYADFQLPEGVTLSAEQVGEVQALAKEFNLPQDKAQKLVETMLKQGQSAEAAMQARFDQGRKDWETATRNDKEIGGDKLDDSLATAKKALETFGTQELRAILDASGLGNHPEVVRAFARVGAAISEDRLVTGGTATSNPASRPADVMYGYMNKS